MGWVSGVLQGSLVVSLCVIAVAIIGLMAMTGRLVFRDGLRVVLGCFVLLGAPVVASGMFGAVDGVRGGSAPVALVITPPERADQIPPANYDPYAGASLRRR